MQTTIIGSALLIAAVLATPACDKSDSTSTQSNPLPGSATTAAVAPSTSAIPPAAASSVAEEPGPGRGPGHGGIDGMFFRATKDLALTPDQQTKVDALKQSLRDRDTSPQDAMKALHADLVSEVRAGKMDPTKVKVDETAIDAAMTTMHDKQAKALDGLHGILDAGQRRTVTDAIRARWAAHDKGGDADAGAADWSKKRVDRMTTDLGLDATQQTQLAALIAKQNSAVAMKAMHDASKAQMDALLTAFAGDTFDASKALPTTMGGKTPHDMIDRHITFLTQLVALLHPDQRDKLATQMEKVPGAHGYAPLEDQEETHEGDDSKPSE